MLFECGFYRDLNFYFLIFLKKTERIFIFGRGFVLSIYDSDSFEKHFFLLKQIQSTINQCF
ncbi:hypothetical protein EGI22_13220 [Lacihabitans sp. LS3-19]|nr:hypothetical protein [Lacihabitans sp. LS3-19]